MTGNDWSGDNPAVLGGANVLGGGASPGTGNLAHYPDAANANMSFNVYLLSNTNLEDVLISGDILVPEPVSLALLGLGGLTLLILFRYSLGQPFGRICSRG